MAIDRITTGAVLDGAIATADIADDAVTSGKIADDAVTSAKLDTNIAVAGNLTVDTNTLKVDATNNRVGVGNASPIDALHIRRTDGTTVGNVLNIDNSAGSSTHGAVRNEIRVVSDNNGYWANLRVQGHSTLFDPQGSGTKVRIDGDGLKFGTDTAAANALDDYEEGTWTPTFAAGISSPVYSIQTGRYTKVGRAVYVESDIRVTGGSVTSAHVYMGGLPFTVSSAAPYSKLDIIYQGGFHNISYPSVWLCIAGTTTAAFYRNTDGGAILGNQITSSFTNATIRIGGWYIT